ncbi:MAG: methyltransferase domain-containing protein [Crocinitomicaceae bacterium]|nr:methyltransferase domain-containing protein [Crocinitomicaceae bacterium]
MEHLSKNFWESRYEDQDTGWDLGEISPPIKAYFDQVEDKSLRILIPGCGNGHEAEYLFNLGFENVHAMDLAEEPLRNLMERVPTFPEDHIIFGDFFTFHGEFDIIVEQTLFCAIDPELRSAYASKCEDLLSDTGKIVGVMFNHDFTGGPPYGGTIEEYLTYFDQFTSVEMEECYNSIEPRKGRELFVKISK